MLHYDQPADFPQHDFLDCNPGGRGPVIDHLTVVDLGPCSIQKPTTGWIDIRGRIVAMIGVQNDLIGASVEGLHQGGLRQRSSGVSKKC